jgi:hypothetical protein
VLVGGIVNTTTDGRTGHDDLPDQVSSSYQLYHKEHENYKQLKKYYLCRIETIIGTTR